MVRCKIFVNLKKKRNIIIIVFCYISKNVYNGINLFYFIIKSLLMNKKKVFFLVKFDLKFIIVFFWF